MQRLFYLWSHKVSFQPLFPSLCLCGKWWCVCACVHTYGNEEGRLLHLTIDSKNTIPGVTISTNKKKFYVKDFSAQNIYRKTFFPRNFHLHDLSLENTDWTSAVHCVPEPTTCKLPLANFNIKENLLTKSNTRIVAFRINWMRFSFVCFILLIPWRWLLLMTLYSKRKPYQTDFKKIPNRGLSPVYFTLPHEGKMAAVIPGLKAPDHLTKSCLWIYFLAFLATIPFLCFGFQFYHLQLKHSWQRNGIKQLI